jgi:hypothetical protein
MGIFTTDCTDYSDKKKITAEHAKYAEAGNSETTDRTDDSDGIFPANRRE